MLSVEANQRVTFGVRYEDEDLLVIEKPARVPTQPGKGHQTDTLLNGLFARWGNLLQNLGKARDFGLLHRLDKDTSGLLIVALRPRAYDALREMFGKREIGKFYWAICSRTPREPSGVIKLPIIETSGNRGPKLAHVGPATDPRAKPAITAYRVLASSDLGSVIEARAVTGRLHQVRVHLDAIGCPIVGDRFYGPKATIGASPRLALHSHRVTFRHPITGAAIDVSTDWPRDLHRVLGRLKLLQSLAEQAKPDQPDKPDKPPDDPGENAAGHEP